MLTGPSATIIFRCHGCWLSQAHQNIVCPWILTGPRATIILWCHGCWLSQAHQNIVCPWILTGPSATIILWCHGCWLSQAHQIFCCHSYWPSWLRELCFHGCWIEPNIIALSSLYQPSRTKCIVPMNTGLAQRNTIIIVFYLRDSLDAWNTMSPLHYDSIWLPNQAEPCTIQWVLESWPCQMWQNTMLPHKLDPYVCY